MKVVVSSKNKIESVFEGDGACIPVDPSDYIVEAPFGFSPAGYDDIRCWDSEFNLITAEEMIAKGYRTLKNTEKIENHVIIKKTMQELYDEGIYIPEEGWIVFDNQLWKLSEIEKYRVDRYNFINRSFDKAMETGFFMSEVLGIYIDCRRSATKNDLQNIQTLMAKMDREGWTEIEYVGLKETKVATRQNLTDMAIEMEDYALGLYQHKWLKWEEVSSAITIPEIESIVW